MNNHDTTHNQGCGPDVPTPITTQGEAFAVRYGTVPTRTRDGDGFDDNGHVVTETPDGTRQIHVSFTTNGVTAVSAYRTHTPTDIRYQAADNQPDRGTRWVAEGEPDIEIVPVSALPAPSDHLQTADDALEQARDETECEWQRNAIDEIRADLATLAGGEFQTASEMEESR